MSNRVDGADFLASILADDPDIGVQAVAQTVLSFQISRTTLLRLLEKAIMVIPTRDVMPVLKCFQLDATPSRLRVVGSDVQLTMVASTLAITGVHPGVAVFPARKLHDIVKSAEDAPVTITVTGSNGHISIGRASWSLKLPGGDDYPALPAITEAAFVTVERTVFMSAIQAVRYAASRDPAKVNLNVIDITDGALTTCDGARIQQVRIDGFPMNLKVPISSVDDLLRLLKLTKADMIKVGQSDNKIIFQLGDDVFIVNKLVAAFPDIQATMLRPAMSNKHRMDVARTDLLAAVRRIRINADTDSAAIALTLHDNVLTVAAKDKHGNTATETVVAGWSGPARTLVVNHTHLTDALSTHPDEVCTFHLGDDTKTRRSPLLLRDAHGNAGVLNQMNIDWAAP